MRKLAEKIAIVAQICITLVFAITALLSLTDNYLPNNTVQYNGVLPSLMFVLFLAYTGLSAYIVYVNFSERESLKRVLLFCDSGSATRASSKVIRNIISECARATSGVKVKKAKIRDDDKHGLALTLTVVINGDDVSRIIDTFRCMLDDSFKNMLGTSFNTINFEVTKLNAAFDADLRKAKEQADKLSDQRELAEEMYREPLENDVADCVKKQEDETQRDEDR